MTQEEKQLLLKDLCAREPYHPRIQVFNQGYEGFQDGEFDTNLWLHHIDAFRFDRIEILPYLRPMSSMTEEERAEMGKAIQKDRIEPYGEIKNFGEDNLLLCTIRQSTNLQDWLNAHHFDYRGLIEKGLALETEEGTYNT